MADIGTAPSATNDWGWLVPLLTGAGNLFTARTDMNDAERAAGMADPFASQRGGYQDQLQEFMQTNGVNPAASTARTSSAWDRIQRLLSNPNSITTMPGYQFGLNQALEGVNRAAGASGMLGSGNRLMALQDRSEKYAADAYQREIGNLFNNLTGGIAADQLGLSAQQQGFNELGRLSGLFDSNPGLAVQLLMRGRENQAGSIGSGIGGITQGLFGSAAGGGSAIQAIQRMLSGGGASLLPNGDINWGSFTGSGDQDGFPGEIPGFDLSGFNPDLSAAFQFDPGADWGALFGGFGGP